MTLRTSSYELRDRLFFETNIFVNIVEDKPKKIVVYRQDKPYKTFLLLSWINVYEFMKDIQNLSKNPTFEIFLNNLTKTYLSKYYLHLKGGVKNAKI